MAYDTSHQILTPEKSYRYPVLRSPDGMMPEFYDTDKEQQKYENPNKDAHPERAKRKVNNSKLSEYMNLWHERGKAESDRIRRIVEMWVMIHRRYRAVTVSDAYGYWGTIPQTMGRWIDYDPEEDGEVHPINIVRPDIRANVSVLLRVRPVVKVEPINQNARASETARRLRAVADFFDRTEWNEADRNLIFDGIHKEGTWLIEEYTCPDGESIVHTPQQSQTYYAVYQCADCGANGKKPIPSEMGEQYQSQLSEMNGKIPCPECGKEADGIIKNFTNTEMSEQSLPKLDIKHRLWSGFNFIVDRKGARAGGIETAQWMRLAEVITRTDLEADHSDQNFDDACEHSFPLRCQQALACGDWSMISHVYSPLGQTSEFDEFEKLTYCLHESAYRGYVSPADEKFLDKDGNEIFSIQTRETIAEAQERCFGKNHKGFRFIVVNDAVIRVVSPEDGTILNFRDAFTDVHFNRDSASFLSVPHWDSVDLQDNITNLFSIKVESAAANSKQPVAFNSAAFDIEDFGDYYIPTKDEFADEGFDLRNAIYQIPAAKTTEELNQTLEFMLTVVRPQVSSVTPAMKGESQPGQPFAAQRQQLEQSFGILSPATKSFIQMFLSSMKKKVKIAQQNWTAEQFQRVASMSGEEWTDEEVQELCATDLDKDVRFTYVQGSENPQTQLDQEMRFYGALQQLMPFIQGGAVPPMAMQMILKKIDEFGGFDFDLSGLEKSDALAQTRFERFSVAAKPYESIPRQKFDLLKQQVVSVQQQMQNAVGPDGVPVQMPVEVPITAYDIFIEDMFSTADIYVSEFENHDTQAAYFVEKIVDQLALQKTNYALVELMDHFVRLLQGLVQQKQTEAIENDPALNEEKRRAEEDTARENQRAELDAQRAAEEKGNEREAQMQERDESSAQDMIQQLIATAGEEDSRNFEREKMDRESAENQAARDHDMAKTEKTVNAKTKQEKSKK